MTGVTRMLCCIRLLVAGTLLLGLVLPAEAVEPGEMLDDPALEARAQALDDDLRCVKCRSESIASSNAEWASDARVKVRELLSEGATDAEVRDFFVARYGEYVLMTPTRHGANWILWGAGPLMLVLGGGIAAFYLRRRTAAGAGDEEGLTNAEKARLWQILDK